MRSLTDLGGIRLEPLKVKVEIKKTLKKGGPKRLLSTLQQARASLRQLPRLSSPRLEV